MKVHAIAFVLVASVFAIECGCGSGDSSRHRHPSFESYGAKKDILEVVPELQHTAMAANGGALGCGMGTITIATSSGELQLSTGSDPIHVFGRRVDIANIHKLLQSRVHSNKTGKPGPMSKDVDDLCYVSLSLLAAAKDIESVPILIPLLTDKSETVRRFTTSALIAIADAHPETKAQIDKELSNQSLQGKP
jgi:hypothetical protein